MAERQKLDANGKVQKPSKQMFEGLKEHLCGVMYVIAGTRCQTPDQYDEMCLDLETRLTARMRALADEKRTAGEEMSFEGFKELVVCSLEFLLEEAKKPLLD